VQARYQPRGLQNADFKEPDASFTRVESTTESVATSVAMRFNPQAFGSKLTGPADALKATSVPIPDQITWLAEDVHECVKWLLMVAAEEVSLVSCPFPGLPTPEDNASALSVAAHVATRFAVCHAAAAIPARVAARIDRELFSESWNGLTPVLSQDTDGNVGRSAMIEGARSSAPPPAATSALSAQLPLIETVEASLDAPKSCYNFQSSIPKPETVFGWNVCDRPAAMQAIDHHCSSGLPAEIAALPNATLSGGATAQKASTVPVTQSLQCETLLSNCFMVPFNPTVETPTSAIAPNHGQAEEAHRPSRRTGAAQAEGGHSVRERRRSVDCEIDKTTEPSRTGIRRSNPKHIDEDHRLLKHRHSSASKPAHQNKAHSHDHLMDGTTSTGTRSSSSEPESGEIVSSDNEDERTSRLNSTYRSGKATGPLMTRRCRGDYVMDEASCGKLRGSCGEWQGTVRRGDSRERNLPVDYEHQGGNSLGYAGHFKGRLAGKRRHSLSQSPSPSSPPWPPSSFRTVPRTRSRSPAGSGRPDPILGEAHKRHSKSSGHAPSLRSLAREAVPRPRLHAQQDFLAPSHTGLSSRGTKGRGSELAGGELWITRTQQSAANAAHLACYNMSASDNHGARVRPPQKDLVKSGPSLLQGPSKSAPSNSPRSDLIQASGPEQTGKPSAHPNSASLQACKHAPRLVDTSDTVRALSTQRVELESSKPCGGVDGVDGAEKDASTLIGEDVALGWRDDGVDTDAKAAVKGSGNKGKGKHADDIHGTMSATRGTTVPECIESPSVAQGGTGMHEPTSAAHGTVVVSRVRDNRGRGRAGLRRMTLTDTAAEVDVQLIQGSEGLTSKIPKIWAGAVAHAAAEPVQLSLHGHVGISGACEDFHRGTSGDVADEPRRWAEAQGQGSGRMHTFAVADANMCVDLTGLDAARPEIPSHAMHGMQCIVIEDSDEEEVAGAVEQSRAQAASCLEAAASHTDDPQPAAVGGKAQAHQSGGQEGKSSRCVLAGRQEESSVASPYATQACSCAQPMPEFKRAVQQPAPVEAQVLPGSCAASDLSAFQCTTIDNDPPPLPSEPHPESHAAAHTPQPPPERPAEATSNPLAQATGLKCADPPLPELSPRMTATRKLCPDPKEMGFGGMEHNSNPPPCEPGFWVDPQDTPGGLLTGLEMGLQGPGCNEVANRGSRGNAPMHDAVAPGGYGSAAPFYHHLSGTSAQGEPAQDQPLWTVSSAVHTSVSSAATAAAPIAGQTFEPGSGSWGAQLVLPSQQTAPVPDVPVFPPWVKALNGLEPGSGWGHVPSEARPYTHSPAARIGVHTYTGQPMGDAWIGESAAAKASGQPMGDAWIKSSAVKAPRQPSGDVKEVPSGTFLKHFNSHVTRPTFDSNDGLPGKFLLNMDPKGARVVTTGKDADAVGTVGTSHGFLRALQSSERGDEEESNAGKRGRSWEQGGSSERAGTAEHELKRGCPPSAAGRCTRREVPTASHDPTVMIRALHRAKSDHKQALLVWDRVCQQKANAGLVVTTAERELTSLGTRWNVHGDELEAAKAGLKKAEDVKELAAKTLVEVRNVVQTFEDTLNAVIALSIQGGMSPASARQGALLNKQGKTAWQAVVHIRQKRKRST
jgi:hypothetical protein